MLVTMAWNRPPEGDGHKGCNYQDSLHRYQSRSQLYSTLSGSYFIQYVLSWLLVKILFVFLVFLYDLYLWPSALLDRWIIGCEQIAEKNDC